MSSPPQSLIQPADAHNDRLVGNVHPPGWVNPEPTGRYNLVVLGAGTAGLVTAAGAAGLGARVALVERHLMGGDCLNVGCVPSKAIIRSARSLGEIARAASLGVRVPEGVSVDFGAVMERMRRIRAGISKEDSAQRFKQLGVDVFLGAARFTGPDTVSVDGTGLRFKKAVIATGAKPVQPQIPGLEAAGFLTNETLFSITEQPRRLGVIGGGPIGCEMAQTFRRLGSEVVLLDASPRILSREDEDAAQLLQQVFAEEGVRLVLSCSVQKVEVGADGKTIHYECPQGGDAVTVDEILVGAGRAPNVEGLGLEDVGVEYDLRSGVQVDDRLRTTNPRIYAAGDVCMAARFTHAADFAARIVIQNSLFFGRARLSALNLPWCTYTSPEIAHVGLYERDARARGIDTETYLKPMAEVDRALADGEENGFVKILLKKGSDQILGATIVATHAGDMISEISVAMKAKLGLGKIAAVIHPYPTQADAIRRLGDAYNRTRLTPRVKKLFAAWLRWTR